MNIFHSLIFRQAVRILNVQPMGPMLNRNLSSLLDEKDQGVVILTHIYLLVGSSLPLWICPFTWADNAAQELLLLSAGVLSLGVGDTAASVGGTMWGKTKIAGTSKSVQGTVCSIAAQILFVTLLIYFGNCLLQLLL